MTSLYYTPSGRVPGTALPIVALYALATLPIAWVYAWLMLQIPAGINVLCTICYSICLGAMVRGAAARGKVRNPARMATFGTIIGAAGWYWQWAAWMALAANRVAEQPGAQLLGAVFLEMALHLGALLRGLTNVAQSATFSIAGAKISGIVLVMFWLGELAILVGMSRLCGRLRSEEPFSESSNTWAEKIEMPCKFALIDEPDAVRIALERQPRSLPSLLGPWRESVSPSHAKATLYRGGSEDAYLSLDNVMVKVGRSKVEESVTPVLACLRLPGIDPDELVRLLTRLSSPPSQVEGVPLPEELEAAVDHLNADRHAAAFEAAQPHVDATTASVRTDANRVCALACSRLGRWEAAAAYWQTLFADEPTVHNALQVATSLVMAGDLAGGNQWMERAGTLNASTYEMPRMTLDTNFVSALTQSGNMQAAMPYVENIRSGFVASGNTDPNFLTMRHFPHFDVFLDRSAPIVRASLAPDQVDHWYRSMLPHLDERGKVELSAWLKSQQPGQGVAAAPV